MHAEVAPREQQLRAVMIHRKSHTPSKMIFSEPSGEMCRRIEASILRPDALRQVSSVRCKQPVLWAITRLVHSARQWDWAASSSPRRPRAEPDPRSRRLAPEGGETEFCNTYAAYDTLPNDERQALEGCR